MKRRQVFGQYSHTEVVTVHGPDEITVAVVNDLNGFTARALAGHAGTVRWEEPGFEGYLETSQHFVGEGAGHVANVSGGRAVSQLGDAGLPDTSAPAQYMSPMQALLGEVGR